MFLLGDIFPLQYTTDLYGPRLFFTSVLHPRICSSIWKQKILSELFVLAAYQAVTQNTGGTYYVAVCNQQNPAGKDPGGFGTIPLY